MSDVTVIYNPASGGAESADRLRAAFAEVANGHRIRWAPTTAADPGPGQAAEAIERGSDTVIACGGDGTVRAVVDRLAGTGVRLGVVPLGTGNLLAGNLGLPVGLDAIPAALDAEPTRLDVGRVNGERFAVMAGIGFDALMIRDAPSTVKRRLGSVAYVVSGVRHVPARLFRAEVSIDGEPAWSGWTPMVLVGNCGSVTGGLEVFPDARPDDGVLDVAILTASSLRDWSSVLWRLVRHRPQPDRLVRYMRGRHVEVRLDRRVAFELDGEDREPTSALTFDVEPLAIEVRR